MIIFLLLCLNLILWNVFTPVFEAVDEPGYYQHVLFLAKEKKLPNLNYPPNDAGVMSYPPTYYLFLTPIAFMMNPLPDSSPYGVTEKINFRQGFRDTVFNRFNHTDSELRFDWSNQELAVHLMRLVSSLFGLGTVWLVYRTALVVFSKKPLALFTSVFVGFNPMFAHLHSTIIVLPLLIFLSSLSLYLLLFWKNNLSLVRSFLIGLIIGLAVITKATGLLLTPIALLAIWLERKNSLLYPITRFALLSLGTLLVSGWYFVRNLLLYGSLLGINEVVVTTGSRASMKDMMGPINYWVGFITAQFTTFWSGYGWVAVNFSKPLNWLLGGICLIAIVGCIKGLKSKRTFERDALVFLVVSLTIFVAFVALAHSKFPAFHAKDIYPMIVPISILFVFGWYQILLPKLDLKKINIKTITLGVLALFTLETIYLIGSVSPKLSGITPLF